VILSLSVYYIAYAFDSCSLAYPVLRLVKGQCRPNAACKLYFFEVSGQWRSTQLQCSLARRWGRL